MPWRLPRRELQRAEAASLGRRVCDEAAGLYVEAVLELDTKGAVVWEWYLSNHVCADDCEGDLRRVDINSGVGASKADWEECEFAVPTRKLAPLTSHARGRPLSLRPSPCEDR